MQSWIESANTADCPFPIQNLPFGVFSTSGDAPHCATAIGDQVLDLAALEVAGLIDTGAAEPVFDQPALTAFMALGNRAWQSVRDQLTDLLDADGNPVLRDNAALRAGALVPMAEAQMHLPFKVAEYTDGINYADG